MMSRYQKENFMLISKTIERYIEMVHIFNIVRVILHWELTEECLQYNSVVLVTMSWFAM